MKSEDVSIDFFLLGGNRAGCMELKYKKPKSLWDTVTVLNNPHKGWCIHYYDNSLKKYRTSLQSNELLEDFLSLHHVYLWLAGVTWSLLRNRQCN
jgi:hypothetical protein